MSFIHARLFDILSPLGPNHTGVVIGNSKVTFPPPYSPPLIHGHAQNDKLSPAQQLASSLPVADVDWLALFGSLDPNNVVNLFSVRLSFVMYSSCVL